MNWLVFALVLAASLSCLQQANGSANLASNGPHGSKAEHPQPGVDSLWLEVLECALERDNACKTRIEAIDESESQPVQNLATVVLAEWDLGPSNKQLHTPRLVWQPEPDLESIHAGLPEVVDAEIVVVEGTITAEGMPVDPSIIKKSRYSVLNEHAVEQFLSARFRPARGATGFVQSSKTVPFQLHVN